MTTRRASRSRDRRPNLATLPLLGLVAGAALTLVALLATRPQLPDRVAAWTADDLAMACAWSGAVMASAWLSVTTLACLVALAHGNARTAHRVARWAPPLARRVVQAALVSTWALVPTAAYASPPPAPVTVHVGAGGRLVVVPGPAEPREAPVVRTPPFPATRAPTSIGASTTTTPAAPSPPTLDPAARPAPVPTAPLPRAAAPGSRRVHVVQPGDNLWRIARSELIRSTPGARPDDTQIASYWRRVIAANRSTLRSGDPSLIFPGEAVTLPAPTL